MFQLALFDNTLDFFVKGGIFMAVLLICSFVALTVILLRMVALRRRAVIPPLIEKEINKIRPGEEPEHLRHLIQDDDSPLSRIVEVAVRPLQCDETGDAGSGAIACAAGDCPIGKRAVHSRDCRWHLAIAWSSWRGHRIWCASLAISATERCRHRISKGSPLVSAKR